MTRNRTLETAMDYMKAYPRVTAHIIAESLGYATPSRAADILRSAHKRQPNYCEWIYSRYGGASVKAVKDAIRNRHYHKGYMAEYKLAKVLVEKAVKTGDEPIFGSWF